MTRVATARRLQGNHSSRAEDQRKKMLARIHVTFPQIRPDLHHSPEEMKEARLEFVNEILQPKKPITSMRNLKPARLSKIIDAIEEIRRQPNMFGYKDWIEARKLASPGEVKEPESEEVTGDIRHTATAEQLWAINRILKELRWSEEGVKKFLRSRFSVTSPAFLTPREANDLIPILLRIAIHNDLKRKNPGIEKVGRAMINANMRAMKQKLGLDQGAKL
jgi:hypothetical protein